MQLYVDLNKRSLSVKENEKPISYGNQLADKLELYVKKSSINQTNGFFSITGLLSTGRKIGHFTHDGTIKNEIVNKTNYYVYTFTMTKENGYTLAVGQLELTIWFNKTTQDGLLKSREAIGNVVLNVKEATTIDDNIVIVGNSGETIKNFELILTKIENDIYNLKEDIAENELDIVNNLNSGGVDKALSAEQGKYLNRKINEKYEELDSRVKSLSGEKIYDVGSVINPFLVEKQFNEIINIKDYNDLKNVILTITDTTNAVVEFGYIAEYEKDKFVFETKSFLITLKDGAVIVNKKVVDTLNSDDTKKPLSANQGRILNNKIARLEKNGVGGGSTGGVSSSQVLGIIEENSTKAETIAIATSDGFDLNSDSQIPTVKTVAKIVEQNGGSGTSGSVNLTKKIPVPNNFGANEFYFDTSKSIDEVVNILSQLEYNSDGNYQICEHIVGGWYNFCIHFEDDERFIIFSTDEDDYFLFDDVNGWNNENIIDGKFDIPTDFKGGGYHNAYGNKNNLLIDLIWCEQPIYVQQKEVIAENDLEVEVNFYQNTHDGVTYYPTYDFKFKGDYLQNKNVILNLPNYIQEGEDLTNLEFDIYTNFTRNCKMTIILPETFNRLAVNNMGMFNAFGSMLFNSSSLEYIYEEGTHYPFYTDNYFLFYNSKEWMDYFIVIEWDADGFATINMLQSYEF